MGKTLKAAIVQLWAAIGSYAFPNGRPQLDFDDGATMHCNYSQTLGTNVTSDKANGSQLTIGDSLTVHLGTSNNDYAIDDSSVVVTMGGNDITASVYDGSTDTIVIDVVTADVNVVANAVETPGADEYSQPNHLVFQLDGLEGSTADKWTDLIGGIEFTNHGATKVATGWDFANSAYMDSANAMSGMDYNQGTLEVCFTSRLSGQGYFIFAAGGSNLIMCFAAAASYNSGANTGDMYIARAVGDNNQEGVLLASSANVDKGIGQKIVSINLTNAVLNGETKSFIGTFFSKDDVSLIGCRQKNGTREKFFDGVIHAIRYYDTQLTAAEILANQRLDNERFNLGLTINS